MKKPVIGVRVLTVIVNAKLAATVDRGRFPWLVTRACQNTTATLSFLPFSNNIILGFRQAPVDYTALKT